MTDGPMSHPTPQQAAPADAPEPPQQPHEALPAPPPYDPSIFQHTIPAAELAPLLSAEGRPAGEAYHDKALHKLLHNAAPNVTFHYGKDISLPDTLDMEFAGSGAPVMVREGRYVILVGNGATTPWIRHDGRTLLWVDTHDGVMLGAFFFHPTNGEPSPTVTVFSRQIKQDGIGVSELPPAFLVDLQRWQRANGIPLVSTLYFIGDANKKILLEHDNDFCMYNDPSTGPPDDCDQMNADAADADMIGATYLQQVHYATNATARMMDDPDQIAFVELRNSSCRRGPNPLHCRVIMTREHIHRINPRPVRPGRH